jgi:hypothetical protein
MTSATTIGYLPAPETTILIGSVGTCEACGRELRFLSNGDRVCPKWAGCWGSVEHTRQASYEAHPCRSCAKWDEKSFQGGAMLDLVEGGCRDKVNLPGNDVECYGVDTQGRGQSICPNYQHEGFDW